MTSLSLTPGEARVPLANQLLTPAQVERFRALGYHSPIRVLNAAKAAEYRGRLEAFEAAHGGPLAGELRHKCHLLFTWLDELIRCPAILDAVEGILGPDLLVWSTSFFIKEAHDPSYVSWHQDSTYWGLSSPDVVTAWVALSPSTIESGAMRAIPGSHLEDQLPHRDTFAEGNMLTRGQEVMVDIDGSQAVDFVLQPGEMSLHHVRLVHGSEPNRSGDRRIGFAIRYIPTHVRQIAGNTDSATLVRGVDRYRHFEEEPPPKSDFTPEALALHAQITGRQVKILYRGTDVKSFS